MVRTITRRSQTLGMVMEMRTLVCLVICRHLKGWPSRRMSQKVGNCVHSVCKWIFHLCCRAMLTPLFCLQRKVQESQSVIMPTCSLWKLPKRFTCCWWWGWLWKCGLLWKKQTPQSINRVSTMSAGNCGKKSPTWFQWHSHQSWT